MVAAWTTWRLALVALVSAACAAPPKTCPDVQAKRIGGFVGGLRAVVERAGVELSGDLDVPVVAAQGVPIYDATLVELDRRGLRIAGERVDAWRSTTRLMDLVAREEAIAAARRVVAEPVLVAAIAADVPARDVAELLDLARRSGHVRAGFVATPADAPPIPAPPDPRLAASLHEHAAGSPRRAEAARLLDAEVARCPALGERMEDNIPTGASILASTQEALLACGCAVDVDRVLTLAHAWVSPGPVTIVSPPLSLGPGGETLAAGPDTPWSELAPAVFAGARAGIWLRVEASR